MKKLWLLSIYLITSIIWLPTIIDAQSLHPKFLKNSSASETELPKEISDESEDIQLAFRYPFIVGSMVLDSGIIKNILQYSPDTSPSQEIATVLFHLKVGVLNLSEHAGAKLLDLEKIGELVRAIFLQKDILEITSSFNHENIDQKNLQKIEKYISLGQQNPQERLTIIYLFLGLATKIAKSQSDVEAFCKGLYQETYASAEQPNIFSLKTLKEKENLSFEEVAALNIMNHRESRNLPVILPFTEISTNIPNKKFSDCVENTLHNIIRLFSFDYFAAEPTFSPKLFQLRFTQEDYTNDAITQFIKQHPIDMASKLSKKAFEEEKEGDLHQDWDQVLNEQTEQTKFIMFSGIIKNDLFTSGKDTSYIYIPKKIKVPEEKITIESFDFTPFNEQSNITGKERTSLIINFLMLIDALLKTHIFDNLSLNDLTNNLTLIIKKAIEKFNTKLQGVTIHQPKEIIEEGEKIEIIDIEITPAGTENGKSAKLYTEEKKFIFQVRILRHKHTDLIIKPKESKKGCILSKGLTQKEKNILFLLCNKKPELPAQQLSLMDLSNILIEGVENKINLIKKYLSLDKGNKELIKRSIKLIPDILDKDISKLIEIINLFQNPKTKKLDKTAESTLKKYLSTQEISRRIQPIQNMVSEKNLHKLISDIITTSFSLNAKSNPNPKVTSLIDLLNQLDQNFSFLFDNKTIRKSIISFFQAQEKETHKAQGNANHKAQEKETHKAQGNANHKAQKKADYTENNFPPIKFFKAIAKLIEINTAGSLYLAQALLENLQELISANSNKISLTTLIQLKEQTKPKEISQILITPKKVTQNFIPIAKKLSKLEQITQQDLQNANIKKKQQFYNEITKTTAAPDYDPIKVAQQIDKKMVVALQSILIEEIQEINKELNGLLEKIIQKLEETDEEEDDTFGNLF